MKLAILLGCYALGMAGSNLLLRYASKAQGLSFWVWFVLANMTGFVCVLTLPQALKLAPSNLIYALSIGLGFCLLQISAWLLFREALNFWQWTGVALVALGVVLMQVKS